MSYYIRSYDIISSCVMFDFIKIYLITLHLNFILFYLIRVDKLLCNEIANIINNYYKKTILQKKIQFKKMK